MSEQVPAGQMMEGYLGTPRGRQGSDGLVDLQPGAIQYVPGNVGACVPAPELTLMAALAELESVAIDTQIMLRNALVALRGSDPEVGCDKDREAETVMEHVAQLSTILGGIKHQSLQLERLVGGG